MKAKRKVYGHYLHARHASDWEMYKTKWQEVKSKVLGLKKRSDVSWGKHQQAPGGKEFILEGD